MPSYVPPKKNTAFIMYAGLIDQSNTKLFKSSPTLAAGDFKVSTDGAALANLATLPTNTPGSQMVKFSLSAGEMNGDNTTIVCSDVAGAEWCDLIINVQTAARQVEDLAYPATSGRSLVVDVNGLVDANTVKLGPTGAGTAQTARDLGTSILLSNGTGTGQISLSSGTVTTGTNNDKTGYGLSGAAVQAIWDALTSALTTVGSIGKLLVTNIDTTISSRSNYGGGDTPGTTTLLSRIAAALTIIGGKVDINDKTGFSISGTKTTLDALNDVSNANVLTQVNSALDTAGSELSVVPSTTGTIRQKLNFLFEYFRNKKTVTGSTETLMKEDAATTLGTSTLSDDGTTFTKGEMN